MSKIYSSLKRGQKTFYTNLINEHGRHFIISNDWEMKKSCKSTFDIIMSLQYTNNILDKFTEDEVDEFKEFLWDKIWSLLLEFKLQPPSASQIYRYVEACVATGETIHRIYTNEQIWKETQRIENNTK